MRGFAVEVQAVQGVARDLGATQRRLERLFADLDAQMAALHGTWSGHAATAHAGAHARSRADLDDLRRALVQLAEAGVRAAGSYRSAGEANAVMWRQLA